MQARVSASQLLLCIEFTKATKWIKKKLHEARLQFKYHAINEFKFQITQQNSGLLSNYDRFCSSTEHVNIDKVNIEVKNVPEDPKRE